MSIKWFANMNLRNKIRFFVGIFFGLMIALGVTMYILAQDSLRKELKNRGIVIVKRLAESHSYQVSLGLADELKPIIDKLMRDPSIVYVEFVDTNGKVIQTGDGQFKAQSDSNNRPPSYGQFNLAYFTPQNYPEGQQIKAVNGKDDLYDFYSPVVVITEGAGASAADLQSATEQKQRVIGMVRMAMWANALDEDTNKLRNVLLIAIVVAGVVGILFAYLLGSQTTTPVVRVAEAASIIARGDLSQQVQALSRDELGQLARTFNGMAENLANMIRRIREAYLRVDQGREQIQQSTVQVLEGSKSQVASLEEISSAITEMNSSLKGVAENVENLSASSEQTSSSIMEMAATIEEVSSHIKSLSQSVDETASSITEMVSSIQQVDKSIELLSNLIGDTAVSIKEMEGSIRQVEKNAASSHTLSEQVTTNAEMGMKSVEMTMGGMERIRTVVSKAGEVISKLGSSSEEIGKILNVIDDVAEQTNLLALNAAIIAAQAGEHGKGFAVVAEEIRELAERTASSTKEIDTLIKAVQRDVATAVQTMSGGSQTVEEGVKLSVQAGENLKKILASARTSSDMSKEIAKATEEQSKGIQSINQTVEQIREMMLQITKATAEQKAGSEQIISAVENMREMTGYVNRATLEQSKGSKQITMAIENVTEMVSHIMKATGEQAKGSEQIVKIVEFFKEINQKNMDSVAEMDRALSLLMEQTNILKQEISIFKV
ncbi:MAG: methyl-accepting protein [Acidobacteria bacterium]|nr:MAG: methyl-accepting protein [Acidobacteriota bacterium]